VQKVGQPLRRRCQNRAEDTERHDEINGRAQPGTRRKTRSSRAPGGRCARRLLVFAPEDEKT
jgi:hypothetical protein